MADSEKVKVRVWRKAEESKVYFNIHRTADSRRGCCCCWVFFFFFAVGSDYRGLFRPGAYEYYL